MNLKEFIFRRSGAYKRVFTAPQASIVLEDLASFCRASESTFHPDARMAAMLDGRREVFLRIINHLRLTPEEVFKISTGTTATKEVPLVNPETYHD